MELLKENTGTGTGTGTLKLKAGAKSVLRAEHLSIGYKGRGNTKMVAEDLNLRLNKGQLVCLLGPNGAGKSTLMRTIAGIQPLLSGQVFIENTPLPQIKKNELARKMSLVLTEKTHTGNLSVFNIISLGRYPHLGWLGRLRKADKEIIKWAVRLTEIEPFLHKNIDQLSDGEKQKVMIARALVQETPMIILDEPTAHLDLPNRVEVMRLLKKMTRKEEKSVLLSTHELDLALQAADLIWLFMPDGSLSAGAPEDLILNGTFEQAFRKSGFDFDRISGTFRVNKPDGPVKIALRGGELHQFWTKRALEREGYQVDEQSEIKIVVNEEESSWTLLYGSGREEFLSIEQLIAFLKGHIQQDMWLHNTGTFSGG
jgi:iron complex transport system ATP-binding protein